MREPGVAFLEVVSRPVAQPRSERLRGQRLLQLGIAAGDAVVVIACAFVAAVGQTGLTLFDARNDVTAVGRSVGVWLTLAWMLANAVSGSYSGRVMGAGTVEYARVCRAAAGTAGVVGIGSYLTQSELPRGFFVLLFLVGLPALLVWRWSARRLVHRAHLSGRLLTRVLISGDSRHVDDVAAVLEREAWMGWTIIGALLPEAEHGTAVTAQGVPVLGDAGGTAEVAIRAKADLVVVAEGAYRSAADFRRVAWDLEGHDVQMAVVPSLSDISSGRVTMRPVGGLPLVHVDQPRSVRASRGLKRTFDVLGATAMLLLALPVLVAVALAVRLHDGGPVLFRQTRVGRDGRLFECLKFRSMVVDAEAQLSGVTHLNTAADGVLFKIQRDPRITPVGRFIRRYSLDELPQLVNVINGDMSLVGPRPALPSEVRRYVPDVQRRLHVRPGLTGLWQVSGRSDLSWEDTVRLDLYYVDNWSVVQDLAIMVRTAQAVLRSRGAY